MPRRNLSKEADGEKTAIAVGEVISEAVAEESSVADPPQKRFTSKSGEPKSMKNNLIYGRTLYHCVEGFKDESKWRPC